MKEEKSIDIFQSELVPKHVLINEKEKALKKVKEELSKKAEEIKGFEGLRSNLEKRELELTAELEKAKEGKGDVEAIKAELAKVQEQRTKAEKAAQAKGIGVIKEKFSAEQIEVLQGLLGRTLGDYTAKGARKPLPKKGSARRDAEQEVLEVLQELFTELPEEPTIDLTGGSGEDEPVSPVSVEDDPDYGE